MQVICPCNHERVSTSKIEFLDISEGMQGEDIVTFVCPFCGEEHASVVIAGGYEEDVAEAIERQDAEATFANLMAQLGAAIRAAE